MRRPKFELVYDTELNQDVSWRLEALAVDHGRLDEIDLSIFEWTSYRARDGNDHDHCDGCWQKFMEKGHGSSETHNMVWASNGNTREARFMICVDCYRLLAEVRDGKIKLIEKTKFS